MVKGRQVPPPRLPSDACRAHAGATRESPLPCYTTPVLTPIQFATTDDGLRIAYAVHGAGRVIVHMAPLPLRHVELEWHLPEERRWFDRLARQRKLLRYDPRGLGLSERHVEVVNLDALVLDLAAVVDATGDGSVVLFACLNTAPIAVRYALAHPDRVSHLILWCPVARVADSIAPQIETLLDVGAKDWELFTETVAHVMVGWTKGEAARRYADYFRACVSPRYMRDLFAGLASADVSGDLQDLRVPTLVMQRRGVESVSVEMATGIAARIPGARLAILDGDVMRPGAGDYESAARVIDEFLGDAPAIDVGPAAAPGEAETSPMFRREGDYWTLSFDGQVTRVRDAKGLHHLSRLLRCPGDEFPAAELVLDVDGRAAATVVSPLGDAGPLLDTRAKADYRRRIAELRAEIDEADDANDPARSASARAELERLTTEISAAVGLGGRDRKASSTTERARLTVTKRIKDAIVRIRAVHPALARHLSTSIRTGHLCSYRPETGDPGPWTV